MRSKNKEKKLKSQDALTVIEFSAGSIKLAQSRMDKQIFISKLIVKDGIADSEYEFTKELEKIIKDNHLKINDLIISLDRSLVTIRSVKLPFTSEEEIKNMANWQASKLLPYKVEEMVVSHQTLTVDENGFAHVNLVIAPRIIIRKFINVCEALKLKTKSIALSSEGLLRWYSDAQQRQANDTLFLVDVQKNKSELVIVDQNKFIFSRSFALAQTQDEESAKNKIIEEAKLSMEYFGKQENSPQIKKIVLVGDRQWISDLAITFRASFSLPVDTLDHIENLDLRENISELSVKGVYSFASVCGLALSKKPLEIDLCPPELKDKISYLEKKKELLRALILLFSAVLVIGCMFAFSIYHKKKTIDILNAQIEKTSPAAKEIQNIKNKIAIINRQLDTESSSMEILRKLHEVAPAEIYLNSFMYQEDSEVIIKGTAPSMSLVFSFVPILNETSFFENVQVKYVTQRKTVTGEITDFEIVCKLKY